MEYDTLNYSNAKISDVLTQFENLPEYQKSLIRPKLFGYSVVINPGLNDDVIIFCQQDQQTGKVKYLVINNIVT